MRAIAKDWQRRWVLGEGGFLGEVTLMALELCAREDMYEHGDRAVALTCLFVHPLRRGRGWAEALVRTAIRYADSRRMTLVLWAAPYGDHKGASKKALFNFYAQHGFVRVEGTDDMVRPCQSTDDTVRPCQS